MKQVTLTRNNIDMINFKCGTFYDTDRIFYVHKKSTKYNSLVAVYANRDDVKPVAVLRSGIIFK